MKLTQEEKNIRIAEARGYKHIQRLQSGLHGWIEPGPLEPLPDCFNDLNACHEMERVLTSNQRLEYNKRIFDLPVSECEFNIFATAAQRAEAFGLTLGLWKQGE